MGSLRTRLSLVLMTAVICADLSAITCLLGCDHVSRQAAVEPSTHPCHETASPADADTRLTAIPAGCHGAGEALQAVLPRARATDPNRGADLAVQAVVYRFAVNLAIGDAPAPALPPPPPSVRRPLTSLRL
jgi:hypothetical protein